MTWENPFFIAEVSSNHGRDLERSLALIDAAAAAGCDAVKFQLFKIDQLFAPEILERSEEHRRRKRWELPVEFLPALATRAHERGIEFGCTPFYLDAVAELEPHVDFFKVASYELLWDELLAACAATDKPVILSTGMATLDEIAHGVEVVRTNGGDPAVLHCTSAYPCPPHAANLRAMENMEIAFKVPIGYSDHTQGIHIALAAVALGAEVIEKHLTLDTHLPGPDHKASIAPFEFREMVAGIREIELALGDGVKAPQFAEEAIMAVRDEREAHRHGVTIICAT